MQKRVKKPWPTKKAMEQVYDKNLWGSNNSDFYSGDGSHNLHIVTPYLEQVISFLKSFNPYLTVCDLGCGDFNVGKELVAYTKNYFAIDIVEDLIAYNQEKYTYQNLEFHSLDISKDTLPKADCVFLRQVLQHLSNKEIANILEKLCGYKYLILTEHLPVGNFIPNVDIISGQGIRIKKNSGVNILATPFHFKIKDQKELVKIPLENNKGVIVTTLYTLY